MTATIRDRIMENLKAIMEGMEDGYPASDPYTTTFKTVLREPVENHIEGSKAVLGIYDPSETKTPNTYPVMNCRLRVLLEFHIYVDVGKNASIELNRVLGDLQRLLMADQNIGGLALDIIEEQNEFDIDGVYESYVAGLLICTVSYRHHIEDPRLAI